MSTVIKVEGLSKRYFIGHQSDKRYQTLRDSLSNSASALGRRLLHPFRASSGQPLMGDDNVEEFWALRDVSFEVKCGDRVGIIGRNGAGKSTLLKVLSRITEPTSGRVGIKGRVASLLEVGTGFHPELTGRENIFLNGAVLGMSRVEIQKKFDQIVAFAEVERFLDTPVKRYSSGMYVRLAFAVAAHLEPEVLIVDEVLAVGDIQFQKKCLGKMDQVASEGRTILFVSHNMQAVTQLCDRAVLLNEGRVEKVGGTGAVVDAYLAGGRTFSQYLQLTPDMHSVTTPDLEVRRVEICNRKGELAGNLMVDEPFTLRIHYRIHNPEQGYRLGVTFSTSDERKLATIVSTDDGGGHLKGEAQKTYCLSVKLTNLFLPGTYNLTISVKGQGNNLVDQIERLPFSVDPVSSSGLPLPRGGVVRLAASWGVPELVLPA